MPFDLTPLFRALLAIWAIAHAITTYQGNVLDLALRQWGFGTIVALFISAGLSETFGTRAVIFFLNKLGRGPFVLMLLLTALTYILGGFVWAIITSVMLTSLFIPESVPVSIVTQAIAIGYLPLLFAFLAMIPYLGPAILAFLQSLSLLLSTIAISVGYQIPFWQAAVCVIGGWLIFQLLRWFTSFPTTMISRWLLQQLTGRRVDYQLKHIVATFPLDLQSRHRRNDEDQQ